MECQLSHCEASPMEMKTTIYNTEMVSASLEVLVPGSLIEVMGKANKMKKHLHI